MSAEGGNPWSWAPTRRQALITAVSVALWGCDRAAARPFLSSDTHPEDYPTVAAVREMARLLRERTDGRLDIRIFPGGQLGAERDTLEITTFGGLDMTRVNLAPLNSIEPLTIIPALPFLFRSTHHMRRALDASPGEEILASLAPHDLIGLCFYDSGERSFYTTKRPINSPEDMKGLKIRVPNSDLYVAMIKALGADATPMDLSEVYQALVQGVIDGAENNWPSYETGRHFEPAKYYSLTRHVIAPDVLVMSKTRWDKLSEEDRVIVKTAAKDSVPYMRVLWDKRTEDARTRLLAAGVVANEVGNIKAFSDRMHPVWEKFVITEQQKRIVSEIEAMGEAGA